MKNTKPDAECSTFTPLLPCPFCGSTPSVVADDSYGSSKAWCGECEKSCEVQMAGDLESLVRGWNQRPEFGSVDVMRLRDWLGVKGGDISEDVWQDMDEKTRRLYVCDILEVAR